MTDRAEGAGEDTRHPSDTAGRLSDILRGEAPVEQPEPEVPADQDDSRDDPEEVEAEAAGADEADEPDEQEAGAEGDEQPETYTVEVDGQQVEVTLDELMRGYSREADYTRKTQAVADRERELEAERQRYQDQLTQRIQRLDGIIEANGDDPKPKARDFDGDPDAYFEALSSWEERQEQIEAAKSARDELRQEQDAEREAHFREWAAAEQRKLAAMPEFSTPEKADQTFKGLRSFLAEHGFKEEEVQNVIDSRAVTVALMAKKYHDLQKTKPETTKKVAKAPKRARPGMSPERVDANEELVKRQFEQLRRTGNRRDAAPLLKQFL